MNKKFYRFYGGLIALQEAWLNKMAASGYRLTRTTKAMYEFEPCRPGQYQYRVEFIAHKSRQGGEDYARFLTDCGCQVFFKNINLNYSFGKVVGRPWAEPGGRLASTATTYNRELLIVEKENDGKAFELHTTLADKLAYCKIQQKPWLFLFLVSAGCGLLFRQAAWAFFALPSLAGLIVYEVKCAKLKKNADLTEE